MKRKLFLTIAAVFSFAVAYSQTGLWQRVDEKSIRQSDKLERASFISAYHLFNLDINALKVQLQDAPLRTAASASPALIEFPDGDGRLKTFRVYEAPVMHPELLVKYPGIKSYVGQGIDKPSETIRFSLTLYGLHNMMFSADGTSYTDPYTKDQLTYIVYEKASLTTPRTFRCDVTGESAPKKPAGALTTFDVNATDGVLRTYRLAMACTIEYAEFHIDEAGLAGGTLAQQKEAVLAAMAVTVTRVNSIYEKDLAITLELVANNDDIIFITDDEFDNDNTDFILLEQNQEVVDDVIGFENYDIGHVVSTSSGGVAQLYSPCSEFKAMGVTGLWAPVGDAFDVDFVAHEMGHQFGGNHTFNNDCDGNRSEFTAYEPGSGSTIMGYAGVCFPSIQNNSDAYFHRISIEEMTEFINNWADCSTNTVTGNTAPVVNAGLNYTIPKSTPFILTGTATDTDGDAMTYSWEQMDLEVSIQPPAPNATQGPNFRSLSPKDTPQRYIPDLANVLANNLTPTWEVVSSVGRTYNFSFTVRDNNPLGGQVVYDDMQVIVSGVAGPFTVLSPNTNVSWEAGTSQTVTWDVAGTTANGVNAAEVDILLSTDGGLTYPAVLAAQTPNDGTQAITVPDMPGTTNRIMIRGYSHIFYDLSNTNFTITPAAAGMDITVVGDADKTVCKGSDVSYTLAYETTGGFAGTTTFTVTGNPAGSTVSFNPASTTTAGNVTVIVSATGASPAGEYTITISAVSGAITKTAQVQLELLDNTFGEVTLTSPANNATGVTNTVEFTWNEAENATSYEIEIATDEDFTTIVESEIVATTGFETTLAEETDYYWRVKPLNSCEGSYSETFKFTTEDFAGINDNELANFSLFPNPNNGNFTIRFNSVTGSKFKIAIYDMRGRQLLSNEFPNTGTINQTLSTGSAQAGVYLISIQDGDTIITKKIVIQ